VSRLEQKLNNPTVVLVVGVVAVELGFAAEVLHADGVDASGIDLRAELGESRALRVLDAAGQQLADTGVRFERTGGDDLPVRGGGVSPLRFSLIGSFAGLLSGLLGVSLASARGKMSP
jgi:hypothetical protein